MLHGRFQRPFQIPYPHSKFMIGPRYILGSGLYTKQAIFTVCRGFNLRPDLSFEKPGRGPWYHYKAKVWKSAACRPSSTFSKKTRWLSDFLLRLSKLLEQTLPTQFCRPDSYTIAFRTSCLTVRMERERFDRLENWLQSHRYIFHKLRISISWKKIDGVFSTFG